MADHTYEFDLTLTTEEVTSLKLALDLRLDNLKTDLVLSAAAFAALPGSSHIGRMQRIRKMLYDAEHGISNPRLKGPRRIDKDPNL